MKVIEKVTVEEIKNVVLDNNDEARRNFQRYFSKEIDEFCVRLFRAHTEYNAITIDQSHLNDPDQKRRGYVKAYLYKAIQDLLCGMNLFLSAHLMPYGNSMRHFHESCAMAMALSCRDMGLFERFARPDNTFEVHTVFTEIDKHGSFSFLTQHLQDVQKLRTAYASLKPSLVFRSANAGLVLFPEGVPC